MASNDMTVGIFASDMSLTDTLRTDASEELTSSLPAAVIKN